MPFSFQVRKGSMVSPGVFPPAPQNVMLNVSSYNLGQKTANNIVNWSFCFFVISEMNFPGGECWLQPQLVLVCFWTIYFACCSKVYFQCKMAHNSCLRGACSIVVEAAKLTNDCDIA